MLLQQGRRDVKGFGCRPIRDLSAGAEGRRPKASREGTRGGGRAVAVYGDLIGGAVCASDAPGGA